MSFLTELANKIEVHLKFDHAPGYFLTQEDQEAIVAALRFMEEADARDPAVQPVRTIGQPS